MNELRTVTLAHPLDEPINFGLKLASLYQARFNVDLVSVERAREDGIRRLAYVFNDGNGGYTVEGLYNSLFNNAED